MALTATEGRHPGEFIMAEANGNRSREKITIESGAGVVKPGTVLGKKAVGTASAAAKSGGNTGNATCSAVTVLAGAKTGVYTVRHTAATTFTVEDPDGNVIGSGATGSAFSDDIQFTITAGGTPMVAGDGFDITVAAGSGKYVPVPDTAAASGSTVGGNLAICIYGGDATSADVDVAAIVRDCTVNGKELVYDASVTTDPEKAVIAAALKTQGIIVR